MRTLEQRSAPRAGEPWILPLDSLVLLYNLLMGALVLLGGLELEVKRRLLTFHGLYAASLLVFLWHAREWESPFLKVLREAYPLLTVLFFYKGVGPLIHAYVPGSLDARLLVWDEKLGGLSMAVWNLQRFHPPSPALTEFFNLGYAFYFFLLPLAAAAFYFKAPLARFRAFLFTLTLTFFLHYLFFIILPAESPRFFVPGLREPLEGLWISEGLKGAVEANAYPGGSFPSSHVAAAVVCLTALPLLGRWRVPVLALAFLMLLGTLYGRYHYFVDVLAGLAVGLTCSFLGPWLERKWPLVFDEEGVVRGRREAIDRG